MAMPDLSFAVTLSKEEAAILWNLCAVLQADCSFREYSDLQLLTEVQKRLAATKDRSEPIVMQITRPDAKNLWDLLAAAHHRLLPRPGRGKRHAQGLGHPQREERFLSSQADPLAGAKGEEKVSACSVRNDVMGLGSGRMESGQDSSSEDNVNSKSGRGKSRPYGEGGQRKAESKDGEVNSPLQAAKTRVRWTDAHLQGIIPFRRYF
jgi:hypothetical protein